MIRVSVASALRRQLPVSRRFAARCAREALRATGRRQGRVSVVLVGSAFSRRLNRQFLGHDYVTDTISFPLGAGETPEGEVYVNVERGRTQAREYGVTERQEIARLIAHGTLHLNGFDDASPRQARRMRAMEDRVLEVIFPARGRKRKR